VPPVVVVRPLSGYANRLQAIVSGSLLAQDLGGPLLVCWQESEVAPVPASAVLAPSYCATHVRTTSDIYGELGVDLSHIREYLTIDEGTGVITLAGLDRGEQAFMPDLRAALSRLPDARAVVLSAGGKFTLDGDAVLTPEQARRFRVRRAAGYAELSLHPGIEERAAVAGERQPFVGLHLRYSDRSTQTPWSRDIAPAVSRVTRTAGTASVFVASDTPAQRHSWTERLQKMGLTPWSADPGDFARSDPRSALGALVDWRILTRSQAMVYFAASSFAEEAAVASGRFDEGVGLTASRTRTAWVRAGQYAEAARTYPRRHGWWGGSS
jgi:hypothetical protein